MFTGPFDLKREAWAAQLFAVRVELKPYRAADVAESYKSNAPADTQRLLSRLIEHGRAMGWEIPSW